MTHKFPLRVYYEDTDFGGIVYYANYLKFIERARSEFVREAGVDQKQMKAEGLIFAVRHIEADYLTPGYYDDELLVETTLERLSGARMVFRQEVRRGETLLFSALVTIVAVTTGGQAVRLPANIRQNLQ